MSIRLLSWNIHGAVGADRACEPERIASLISEMRPDVLVLQEVDGRTHLGRKAGAFETFAALLGAGTVEARLFGRPGREHGNLLWSRWPIRHAHVHLLPGGWEQRGAIEAHVETPAGILAVFGTHLGLSPLTRRRQGKAIAALARAQPHPAVVMGDLNEWRSDGWVDRALSPVLPVSLKFPSWPARRPTVPMDRLYASEGCTVEALSAPPGVGQASDHLPLLAKLDPPRAG